MSHQEVDADSTVLVHIDKEPLITPAGESVASALLAAGIYAFGRHPVSGASQGPFCLSGSCQACIVRVDGKLVQACRTEVREGQHVVLEEESVLSSEAMGS